MFEGSLVESRGLVVPGTKRWTALGSAVVQCAVAGLLVAIPLLRPEGLPMPVLDPPKLVAPAPPRPPAPMVKATAASSSAAISVPAAAPAEAALGSPRISHGPNVGPEPMLANGIHMGDGGSLNGVLGPSVAAPDVARPAPVKAVRPNVSSGVSAGLLLTPIQPAYPPIAKAAGVQGTVVMEAVISKTGRIESLRALSGPEMLRGAALAAVQAARYTPYKLNGEPTEVQTTITVNFRLGS